MSIQDKIRLVFDAMMVDFFYYDRKGDDELSLTSLECGIRKGVVTRQFLLDCARVAIEDNYPV